jgi:hypothetical protein
MNDLASARRQYPLGARVYWRDPDNGTCSSHATVIGVCRADMIAIRIDGDPDGYTEVPPHELEVRDA